MMNETLKTIYARRSVRAYKPEQITDDGFETVLKAGEYAPSANNQQSSSFCSHTEKELLDELAALGMKVKTPTAAHMARRPSSWCLRRRAVPSRSRTAACS